MSLFYRICGWLVDRSIPPEAPTTFKSLPAYPKTRASFLTMFGMQAIPHTFSIDADGVSQDEHIGNASIEGNLKKLVGRARELQAAEKTAP